MKMIQKGLFRVCFQPITMMNCCTTCILWEIGSYNTQQSRHNEHMHFCRNFVAKSAIWFSENEGGESKAVWNFSENSSGLETPSFPKMIKMEIMMKMVEITFIEEGWDGHDSETTSPHPFGPNLYHTFKSLHILHFQQIKSLFALETATILWLLHHNQSIKYSKGSLKPSKRSDENSVSVSKFHK